MANELTDNPDSRDDDSDSTDDSEGVTLAKMSEAFKPRILKFSLKDRVTQIILAVAGVLLIVVIIGLVRACGDGDDPIGELTSGAEDIVETLADHADEVGEDDLYDEADRIRDAERDLRRHSDIDYDDIDDLQDFADDAGLFGTRIYWYMVTAVEIASWSSDQETSDSALEAARTAGDYLTNDAALRIGRSLAETMVDTELEERARRDDDESAKEYVEAAHRLLDATETAVQAEVDFWIRRAEAAIEIRSLDDSEARDRLQDSLDDSYNRKEDADEEFDRAVDDFDYYRDRVSWRDQYNVRLRLPWQ